MLLPSTNTAVLKIKYSVNKNLQIKEKLVIIDFFLLTTQCSNMRVDC